MKRLLFLILVSCLPFLIHAQEQQYRVGAIGFYNFENLFDMEDHPDKKDEEFTPDGDKNYTKEVYEEKMDHLARVVSELGTDLSPDGVSILGVAEIENRKVLEDFVKHPRIADRNYSIIHYESPDFRGIDVAMLYQAKYFMPTSSKALPVLIYNDDGSRRVTRDILLVSGLFDGEEFHIMVNHWPSRSGGQAASQPYRNAAAAVCKRVVDSLTTINENAKIIIMGDLNDDPTSPSVKDVLNAKKKKTKVRKGDLYNTMYDYYRKGIGTLAWRDSWNLFDQIIISKGLLDRVSGYYYHQPMIHNKKYMVQKTGQFKGYPFRTYAGNTYLGGYSDHFPVYIYLIKPL
ncbi:MAG: endonuclease/exonuclease/phosphatase family protein [Saprospiraceae bacterium]|nr:endonuclease/exonuclease/phosphatase family protein [Saprospiraceae bacterium]